MGGRVEGLRLPLGGFADSAAPVPALEAWVCVVGLVLLSSMDEALPFLGGTGVAGRVDVLCCCLRLGGLVVSSVPGS